MKKYIIKHKKFLISLVAVILTAVLVFGGYVGYRMFAAAPEAQHSYGEIYEQKQVVINTDEKGLLRVLKINDTHFFDGTCSSDKKTLDDLKVILDKTPCDFIVLDGDIVDGFNLKLSYDKYTAIDLLAQLIESYNTPWTFAPGNNDSEIDGENEDVIAFMMQYENFVCGNEKGVDGDMQFFADVMHNGELVHTIAIIDSGARTVKAIGKYDYIKESQINWLLDGIEERRVKTSIFFHMATPAFKAAYENGEDYDGMPREELFPFDEIPKNVLFDDMTKGNEYISLISTGHIHSNNLCSFYKGRYYQLSSVSGYSAMRMPGSVPSCTLTVIDTNQTDTQKMYSFEKIEA